MAEHVATSESCFCFTLWDAILWPKTFRLWNRVFIVHALYRRKNQFCFEVSNFTAWQYAFKTKRRMHVWISRQVASTPMPESFLDDVHVPMWTSGSRNDLVNHLLIRYSLQYPTSTCKLRSLCFSNCFFFHLGICPRFVDMGPKRFRLSSERDVMRHRLPIRH